MFSFLASVAMQAGTSPSGGFNIEAVFMYGLVAFVIGLIAWSKYREPPLSDPYATRKATPEFAGNAPPAEVGPPGTLPVGADAVPARKQL
jgi:hypothetical protein